MLQSPCQTCLTLVKININVIRNVKLEKVVRFFVVVDAEALPNFLIIMPIVKLIKLVKIVLIVKVEVKILASTIQIPIPKIVLITQYFN